MAKNRFQTQRRRTERGQVIGIDVLPDDVLLEIFDFYMKTNKKEGEPWKANTERWQSMVHVCRRWRIIVFGSPRRLNLQLHCTSGTPVRDILDVWPTLPLIVETKRLRSSDTDNTIAALEQSNRVYKIFLLELAGWQLEEVLAAMQVPFPELTDLSLLSDVKTPPVIPDSFLDGSAPRLQFVELSGIPFPGLPKLLLSATHLGRLCLLDIPHSGYFSPEAIVASLSVLSSLTELDLKFQSPQSCPDRETRHPPPSKRSVIPALNCFRFKGVTEYLDDLLTGIDTPQLEEMNINFFNQIDFDTPRLAKFINRTPTLMACDTAHVEFYNDFASVALPLGFGSLEITISCREPDWQLSSIEQVCNFSLRPLSTRIKDLYIGHPHRYPGWESGAIENTQWLQLLLPFTEVKSLYVSKEFAPGIAGALQEVVGGRITQVLPSLQKIFVEVFEPSGPFQESIGQFIAARQLSDHPITISDW